MIMLQILVEISFFIRNYDVFESPKTNTSRVGFACVEKTWGNFSCKYKAFHEVVVLLHMEKSEHVSETNENEI